MKEQLLEWHSPTMKIDTKVLVIGHAGYPIIIFPTTKGSYHENKDFKMMESVKGLVDQGKIRFYCPSSIDAYSWYNKNIPPAERVKNHIWYDEFLLREVVDSITFHHGYKKVCVAGASFGGFHAANFAFRHPDRVSHLIGMSGAFDVKSFMDGYFDENVYFNDPVSYMPNNNHPDLWKMNIVLGAGGNDICLDANLEMSKILKKKNINHWLDVRANETHDWPLWRKMITDYLSVFN